MIGSFDALFIGVHCHCALPCVLIPPNVRLNTPCALLVLHQPRHSRAAVHTGTAVGIATAFGAPIGGLLFAMEELATNGFSQALGWQTFFACMVGVFTFDTFRSAQSAVAQGRFGLFEGEAGTILFEVISHAQKLFSLLSLQSLHRLAE